MIRRDEQRPLTRHIRQPLITDPEIGQTSQSGQGAKECGKRRCHGPIMPRSRVRRQDRVGSGPGDGTDWEALYRLTVTGIVLNVEGIEEPVCLGIQGPEVYIRAEDPRAIRTWLQRGLARVLTTRPALLRRPLPQS